MLLTVSACTDRRPAGDDARAPRSGSGNADVALATHDALMDGRRIHYLDAGRGELTLVLVHGWASDRRVWSEQVAALARTHRVLAVDLPGHGRSEAPARGHSMDVYADGIAAVLDAAGVSAAVLVGHWLIGSGNGPLFAGFAAILGHSFTPFLRFRGGKSVATSAGVF